MVDKPAEGFRPQLQHGSSGHGRLGHPLGMILARRATASLPKVKPSSAPSFFLVFTNDPRKGAPPPSLLHKTGTLW